MTVTAWWFSEGNTLPHGDMRRVALGKTHKIKGEVVPCENGLHASVRAIDALSYAPGNIVWRVECGGTVVQENDKLACSERTYISGGIDVSDTLRKFARMCALDVVHLWDAPEIVVQYLKTGDESIRDAAWDAVGAAERDAARAAERDAARAAVGAAERCTGAWDAAWNASWDAAQAASRDASRAAERDAAWDAALAKQNRRLTRMLREAINGKEQEK